MNAMPPTNWSKLGQHWQPSDLSPYLYQTMVDVGRGVRLCVEAGGNPDNPPLLFVAGFGSQMVFWQDTFLKQFIDAGFFVIRFDNRDTGLSTKIPHKDRPSHRRTLAMFAKNQLGIPTKNLNAPYTLIDMTHDVVGLIKALGLTKVNVVGASMGGMIAQMLSATHNVHRLILLFSSTNQPLLRPPKPKQFSTFIKKSKSNTEKDLVRHAVWFMTAVGSPGHLDIKHTRQIASLRYQRCHYPTGVAWQMNAILSTGSILPYTRQITAPTLIIHGNKDGLIHKSHSKRLAKTIKNSRLVVVDGMAHDLPAYYQPFLVRLISEHCLT